MSQTARGYKSTCVLDFELTYGTSLDAEDRAGKIMPINQNQLRGTRAKNTTGTITWTRNPAEPFDDRMDVRGNIVVPVDAKAFAYWLIAMFGEPTTTDQSTTWAAETAYDVGDIVVPTGVSDHYYECTVAGTSGATEPTWPEDGSTVSDGTVTWEDAGTEYPGLYDHKFTVGDVQPSMMIEKMFASPSGVITYPRCNGVKIGSWSIDFGGDGELIATLACVGASESLETSAYDDEATAITLERFNKRHAAMKEGGSAVSTATGLDMTVDFGLDDDTYVIAGDVRGDLIEGIIGVTGSGVFFFRDTTLLEKAINSTASAIEVTLTKGDFKLVISIPELQYSQETPEISGPQGVRLTLPYQGYYDTDSNASAIYVTLTNEEDGSDYALPTE